ncbi:MAG: hypothetical protein UY13_C0002G0424 [Candidatus Pacebacteria bacterium GW2011_GWB1_47_8]|nr:MAG: hypothetical protein UX28_C0001G0571 [Candidatus Pacebacteria bacterium GW2011_GWA1_46_10]KKU84512.1 MAG: hypothetical protein UY13_C0002G0424 [Candidatus Pacebacteria bacterium GW2011_GWB1_47_8]HCR81412.1 hypothetical protein [Candidatus Paceibacterota bacterium]
MTFPAQVFLLFFAVVNFFIFLKAFYECKTKQNAFGLTPRLTLIGAFVWGDAVIFGLFWTLVSIVVLFLNDWLLFWLIMSLFWVVRSVGETIYWFNQQFSTLDRNPPKHMKGYSIFQNDSIWFVYQIIWQCVTVVSLVFAVYFGWLWLQSL